MVRLSRDSDYRSGVNSDGGAAGADRRQPPVWPVIVSLVIIALADTISDFGIAFRYQRKRLGIWS